MRSTRPVAAGIAEIASAAEEQSSTAEEISRSIEGISAVNTRGAAQAGDAARDLSRCAEDLQVIVGRFRL